MKNKKIEQSYYKIFKLLNTTEISKFDEIYISDLKEKYDAAHYHNISNYVSLYLKENTEVSNINICPKCGSRFIKKSGYTKSGNPRILCKSCKKTSTITLNGMFFSSKINITSWLTFIEAIISGSNLKSAITAAKITPKTGQYWLKKIFIALSDYNEKIELHGVVSFDETFIPVEEKKVIKNKKGRRLRGTSACYCICCGIDGKGKCFAICKGIGNLGEKEALNIYVDKLKCATHLIHDGLRAHYKVVDTLKVPETIIYSNEPQNSRKPMKSIDNLCSAIKYFFAKRRGYDKKNLKDYLNLFTFIHNVTKGDIDKIYIAAEQLLDLLFNTKNTIRYRK